MAAGTRSPKSIGRLAVAVVAAVAPSDLLTSEDAAGHTAPAVVIAPTVSIKSPADGASVTGKVNATADASDDTGVAGVQFQLDGAPLGSESLAAPYAAGWNTRGSNDLVFGVVKVASGSRTITAG